MKRILIRSLVVILLIVLLPVAYVGITLVRAAGGLPQWDGELSVVGLGAKADVVRDEYGIPYINAATERDLLFVQGFVHAQDRFWQMALTRQAMSGRLAEWMGARAIRGDRIARMWGWERLAQRSLDALPAEDRELLEVYAQGVNAWLDSPTYRRPPEMVVLHIEPERWSAQHAFMIAYSIHQMFPSAGSEPIRAILDSAGATPNAYEIFDDEELFVHPIIAASSQDQVLQPTAAFESITFSDNWTLSGEHTTSGNPLMANDPQIRLSLPGAWQMQHHTIEGRRLAGGSLPGTPGIIVGHNGNLAWGITMASVDGRDFAYLQTHENDSTLYRRGPDSEWQSFEQSTESIGVRFADEIVETVRRTSQGLVWPSDLYSNLVGSQENLTIEIRDIAAENEIATPASFVLLNRALTVEEGIAAVRGIVAPALNLSLADSEGNIGYVTTGRIPLRPKSHATRVGLAPEDDNQWQLLPFDANPRVINPPGGRIVTANQRIIGNEYPHYLSDRWAPPTRANRVHELLDLKNQHSPDSFVTMQSDAYSSIARNVVPFMLKAEPTTDADREILRILRNWDYKFSLDSAAPLIWLTWVDTLRREIASDEFGSAPPVNRYSLLERALSGKRPEWCDDITTSGKEDCAQLLNSSLVNARMMLVEAFGPDSEEWQWGARARFRIPHQGFARLPILDRLFSRWTAIPGGPESLFRNQIRTEDAPIFSSARANSSYQGVYDLSDLDSSLFMMVGGSSGHFRSPFYNNLTELWVDGQRIRLSPDNLSAKTTLTLVPQSAD